MVPHTRSAVKPSRRPMDISSPHKPGHPGLRQDRWLAADVLRRTGPAPIRLRAVQQVPGDWHPAPAAVHGAAAGAGRVPGRSAGKPWPHAAPGLPGQQGKRRPRHGHEGERRSGRPPWPRERRRPRSVSIVLAGSMRPASAGPPGLQNDHGLSFGMTVTAQEIRDLVQADPGNRRRHDGPGPGCGLGSSVNDGLPPYSLTVIACMLASLLAPPKGLANFIPRFPASVTTLTGLISACPASR